ncbi:MAG: hypothetical protein R2705_19940 [Ilumatobacteraceae bacterium]
MFDVACKRLDAQRHADVPERNQPWPYAATQCRRAGAPNHRGDTEPMTEIDGLAPVQDSLLRRMRTMHSLYYQAVESMGPEHVNHFERPGVLPIAFSLFHYTNMQGRDVPLPRRWRPGVERRLASTGPDGGERPRQGTHRGRDGGPADR